MAKKKPVNPFYAALVVVGIAFAITACAYGVMTVRLLDPRSAGEGGLVGLMNSYGVTIMLVELGLLAVLTVAAISMDDYFVRRAEQANQRTGESPPSESA